jgi:hypothetical protein
MRRTAGGGPRRKRTFRPSRLFWRPSDDANGRPRIIWASEMRHAAGDALSFEPWISFSSSSNVDFGFCKMNTKSLERESQQQLFHEGACINCSCITWFAVEIRQR